MCPDELERLLASLPTRQLPPAAEAQILHAIAAAAPRSRSWWRRSVPLWQTAAGCLLAAVLGASSGLWPPQASSAPAVSNVRPRSGSPIVAQLASASAIFGRAARPAYVLDISRWRSLPTSQKGELVR